MEDVGSQRLDLLASRAGYSTAASAPTLACELVIVKIQFLQLCETGDPCRNLACVMEQGQGEYLMSHLAIP